MNVVHPQELRPAPPPPTPPAAAAGASLSRSSGLFVALGYAPLLAAFFVALWGRSHYQFFPLALLAAAFLAWTRRDDAARPLQPGQPVVTLLLLGGSFFLLAVATAIWSPWLGSVAALIGLAGLVWWAGGYAFFRSMVPAMLLLLVIIPPPLNADTRLVQHLRAIAVAWSSRLLDLLAVTHSLSGNVIEVPRQNLLVDEACSGINSVLIMLACSLFYGLWRRRSIVQIVLCLVGSLAFVLLGNMARITIGAWLKFRFSVDILSGRLHELTGLLLFLAYLVLVLSMDQLLFFLTSPARRYAAPTEPSPAIAPPKARRAALRYSPLWGQAAGFAFALLGLLELGRGWGHYYRTEAVSAPPKSSLREGATFAMPEQISDWKRLNTEVPPLQKAETMGVFSQIWHYRRGETLASVAIDYPFGGYHDVTTCYTLRGWDVTERSLRAPQGTNTSPPFAEVQMLNNLGLHGALWFSSVDERGRWQLGSTQNRGLRTTLLERFKKAPAAKAVTYRVQVLVTGFNPLRPAERGQAQELFQEARGVLWRQLQAQFQPRKP
jgi:exosortase